MGCFQLVCYVYSNFNTLTPQLGRTAIAFCGPGIELFPIRDIGLDGLDYIKINYQSRQLLEYRLQLRKPNLGDFHLC